MLLRRTWYWKIFPFSRNDGQIIIDKTELVCILQVNWQRSQFWERFGWTIELWRGWKWYHRVDHPINQKDTVNKWKPDAISVKISIRPYLFHWSILLTLSQLVKIIDKTYALLDNCNRPNSLSQFDDSYVSPINKEDASRHCIRRSQQDRAYEHAALNS